MAKQENTSEELQWSVNLKRYLKKKKKTFTSLSNDEKSFCNDFQTHHYSYMQKTVDPFTWLAMQLLNK